MLSELSSEDITEWRAYFMLKQQFDDDRDKAEAAKTRARQG